MTRHSLAALARGTVAVIAGGAGETGGTKAMSDATETIVLTEAETEAIRREIEHLEQHSATDEEWEIAALAGPCFCAGRFRCTRHKIEDRLS